MADTSSAAPHRAKPLTGRTVLLWLVTFFGLVLGANTVLIRAATSSFGGVETESAYKAGLSFSRDLAEAAAQDARGWRVDATVASGGAGQAVVTVTARDAAGAHLTGLASAVRFTHLSDRRRDASLVLSEVEPGLYRGEAAVGAGAWDLLLDLSRGGERLFRSKDRVSLR
jgi:nitrogen fixation protein FixH